MISIQSDFPGVKLEQFSLGFKGCSGDQTQGDELDASRLA